MMGLRLYGYSKCGTCRKALKWLKDQGHEVEFTDVVETPPSRGELARFAELSGLGLNKLFNVTGEVYKQMGLKDRMATLTDEEKLELLAGNGKLIKRPIVTNGERATIGFREEAFADTWSK